MASSERYGADAKRVAEREFPASAAGKPREPARRQASPTQATTPATSSTSDGKSSAIHPSAAQPPDPRDCYEVAAEAMVERIFLERPELREIVRRESVVISIQVQEDWLHLVAEAWGRLVWGQSRFPVDGDDAVKPLSTICDPDENVAWCEYRRDGAGKRNRTQGNRGVAWAISRGLPVYGFSTAPNEYLPADFMRVVDHEIVVPAPDAAIFAHVITAICGAAPSRSVPADLCASIGESDLMLAVRPGQTPDEYVDRLVKLARQKAQPAAELTLDSLGGMHEAVAWGRQLANDIHDYRAGRIKWKDVDPGALLYGPPGTGKTTFGMALAGSCGIPFFSGSLAEWQAAGTGHLGDLLSAMRGIFQRARAAAPCILFIDEIDSFAARSSLRGSYRDYSVQVVNALLEQLDGVRDRAGVTVVAACNDPGGLDPALVRSGRLDRSIEIPLPSADDLVLIMRRHLEADLQEEDLRPAGLAATGRTGADVVKFVRGARRRARTERRPMRMADLMDEIGHDVMLVTDSMRRRFAVHEAGHAIAVAVGRPGCLVAVTIARSGSSGGTTAARIDPEYLANTPAQLRTILRELMAGRAAEELLLGEPSGGAGGSSDSDLAHATLWATSAVAMHGMGRNSMVWHGTVTSQNLDQVLREHPAIAEEVSGMIATGYADASTLLKPRVDLVETISELLIGDETISGERVEALVVQGMRPKGEAAAKRSSATSRRRRRTQI